jgi:hypothetical protein
MKFENTYTGNFEGAFRGMRFPMDSGHKADTKWYEDIVENERLCLNQCVDVNTQEAMFLGIGPNDMDLAQRLIKAGSPHDKFLRQIFVSVDITAPFYVWKELDQYKVATVTDSESTMHKLTSKPITRECFEMGDFGRLAKTVPEEVIDQAPVDMDITNKQELEENRAVDSVPDQITKGKLQEKLMNAIYGGTKLTMDDIAEAGRLKADLAAIAAGFGKDLRDYIEI